MSAEWTTERLEALPEETLIEWTLPGGAHQAVKEEGEWWGLDPVRPVDGGDILAAARSIRVVSVPIAALLADETVERVARSLTDDWNPDRDPVLTAMFRDYAQTAASTAVSHITREATT